jgi:hypothetical protein
MVAAVEFYFHRDIGMLGIGYGPLDKVHGYILRGGGDSRQFHWFVRVRDGIDEGL